jgi:hydroxymethylbilane synthase
VSGHHDPLRWRAEKGKKATRRNKKEKKGPGPFFGAFVGWRCKFRAGVIRRSRSPEGPRRARAVQGRCYHPDTVSTVRLCARRCLNDKPMNAGVPPVPSIVIASRESLLAMWQAEHVQDRLRSAYPGIAVSIVGMTTEGDRLLDQSLATIGGKGLFIKELEQAMLEARADIAVHSMKDVPMLLPEGFALPAILKREDPRDAFVSNRYATLAELPEGSIVGTSSLRRESQVRARYPHLDVRPLRGNVQTRLRKLDEGQYAGIILASAGLKRLGLAERIASLLTPEESLPAVGQGAVGIECRDAPGPLAAALAALGDAETTACVLAERALSRALAGSCTVPLGGYAVLEGGVMRLRGFVASPDGKRMVRDEVSGPPQTGEALGQALAQRLTDLGAAEILAAL